MSPKEFTKEISRRSNLDINTVESLTRILTEQIVCSVGKGDTILIHGMGTFEPKIKAERRIYNPNTKDFSIIPQKTVLNFKPSATLKELING